MVNGKSKRHHLRVRPWRLRKQQILRAQLLSAISASFAPALRAHQAGLPSGADVVAGMASIHSVGPVMDVHATSARTIVN